MIKDVFGPGWKLESEWSHPWYIWFVIGIKIEFEFEYRMKIRIWFWKVKRYFYTFLELGMKMDSSWPNSQKDSHIRPYFYF